MRMVRRGTENKPRNPTSKKERRGETEEKKKGEI